MSGINTVASSADVVITRLQSNDDGTFGRLVYKSFACYSGELPDRNNEPNMSCIPKGIYKCVWTFSPRMKRPTYELRDVRGRSAIRIHSANFMGIPNPPKNKQVNGCIALGEALGTMNGQKALLRSAPAIRQFEELMKQKEFILEIR